ncbi:MAG: putative zinc-binding peptidase [Planctomycetota bacterium]
MKIDHCDSCLRPVFFENTKCLSCSRALAFFPDDREVCSLDAAGPGLWRRANSVRGATYRLCANFTEHEVCNWVVAADDPNPLCLSCRLTRVIPDLQRPGAKDAWRRLENAKRRLVYSLLALCLPLQNKVEDPQGGLAFEFLADTEPTEGPANHILTGHNEGVIVINVAEADDVEREKRRTLLGEPYRTLLGHFRHEIGHYYWDRLIAKSPLLQPFRACFGDESVDYNEALERHYQQGPPADWSQRFISAYAASHPWEDWAETWAHYMHMMDSVETARWFGVSSRSALPGEKSGSPNKPDSVRSDVFQSMLDDWFALTCVINNLNRGLGMPDAYPFVLTDPVIEKLRFVHRTVTPAPVAENSLAPKAPMATMAAPLAKT